MKVYGPFYSWHGDTRQLIDPDRPFPCLAITQMSILEFDELMVELDIHKIPSGNRFFRCMEMSEETLAYLLLIYGDKLDYYPEDN